MENKERLKRALLKKKVSQKKSPDLIQTHDDEFRVPCS